MTRRKPTFATIGSISGLDPAKDLIGDLAYELKRQLKRCRVSREARKGLVETLQLASAWMPESKISASDVLDKLEQALDTFAPPYARFGQADSCKFGFWPDIDFNDPQLPRTPHHNQEEWQRSMWGQGDCLQVNDHGNVECGYFDRRGVWHEYWSVV